MTVDSLPHDEMEEYYNNPDLLIARAKELRSRMIIELLLRFKAWVVSLFQCR